MVNNKIAAISIIIGLLIGLELNKIYVPENFESPLKYKFVSIIFKTVSALGQLANSLGLGHEVYFLRTFLTTLTDLTTQSEPKVIKQDTTINGIKVRIYKPKLAKAGEKMPIMVYYHGGGYAFGSLSAYDHYLFEYVKNLNMLIISIDYRMSPENPFPIPTNDCFDVTKYVIENPFEFDADVTRLILAGDSAGGDAVSVVTTRLMKEKLQLPKLQVLIYPWLQKFFNKLPSAIRYEKTSFIGVPLSKFASWYLGVENISEDVKKIFANNELFGLIENEERKQILEYLDVKKIPDKYKSDVSYYEIQSRNEIPTTLPENSLLKKDPKMADLFRKLITPEVSPLLAPDEILKRFPKTYILVLEWDSLKDEDLLYAERLKKLGVDVHVSFFENAFHGIASLIQPGLGYQIARDMQHDLLKYLKENL